MKNSKFAIQVFGDFSNVTAVNEVVPEGLGQKSYRKPIDVSDIETGRTKVITVGQQQYALTNTGDDTAMLEAAKGLKTAFVAGKLKGMVVDFLPDGAFNVHPASSDADFMSKPQLA